jgi:phage shock protein C
MNSPYALDKTNARLMGVCAGFARWMDLDPFLVRLTLVLIALFFGPLAIFFYLLTGFIAARG